MSLSNSKQVESPVEKYIRWSGEHGHFFYWNGEKNVVLGEEIHFIVLDQLATISGYHKAEGKGIFANEVRNLSEQPLSVRTFGGPPVAKGLYAEIKADIKAVGGKFTTSVYAALIPSKEEAAEIVNISMVGSSLSSWIDARMKTNGKVVTASKNPEKQKNGTTEYFIPSFTQYPEVVDHRFEEAKKLDLRVQEYLEARFEQAEVNVAAPQTLSTVPKEEPVAEQVVEDELPF